MISTKLHIVVFLIAVFSPAAWARYHCTLSDTITTMYYDEPNSEFHISEVNVGDDTIPFEARACSCRSIYAPDNVVFFCPIENGENMCYVYSSSWGISAAKTLCYKTSPFYERLLRYLLLPAILILVGACVVLFSLVGNNSVQYVLSFCIPSIRRKYIDRILHREMEDITEHIALESAFVAGDNSMIEQLVLKLKTKPINKDHQFAYEDTHCLICMEELEEGGRIGDLSCQHCFHVDCLKTWIKKRNVCPLCNCEIGELETKFVEKDETFNDDDGEGIDDEARSRFERLTRYYVGQTSRRMQMTSR